MKVINSIIKSKIFLIWFSVGSSLFFSACNKENIEDFDQPYVHIMMNELNAVMVNSNRRDIATYYLYYSTAATSKNMELTYEIIPGEGLQEGRDFQVITKENPMLFPSGIYQRPVQIKWLERLVDPTMDNTLTIAIKSTNLSHVSIGLPGSDNLQSEFVIKKVNP